VSPGEGTWCLWRESSVTKRKSLRPGDGSQNLLKRCGAGKADPSAQSLAWVLVAPQEGRRVSVHHGRGIQSDFRAWSNSFLQRSWTGKLRAGCSSRSCFDISGEGPRPELIQGMGPCQIVQTNLIKKWILLFIKKLIKFQNTGKGRFMDVSKDVLAYRKLKSLLLQRKLPPGQKIIYRDLEERLEMSKTPIISALARLENEGLVVSHQNRGFYVRELNSLEIQQMYDLRVRLEEIAIDYAVKDGPPRDLGRVEEALEAYLAYDRPFYDAAYFKLDSGFHASLAELGGNPFLTRMLEQFYLTGWVSVNVSVLTPLMERFKADHRKIVRALERGDGEAAKAVLRGHLTAAQEAIAASTEPVDFNDFSGP
jgi:DNA-binding GntR family transcriptional regulator